MRSENGCGSLSEADGSERRRKTWRLPMVEKVEGITGKTAGAVEVRYFSWSGMNRTSFQASFVCRHYVVAEKIRFEVVKLAHLRLLKRCLVCDVSLVFLAVSLCFFLLR